MVRLKGKWYEENGKAYKFQFHMVRLKANFIVHFRQKSLFQFHMVRLKAKYIAFFRWFLRVSIPYGTIKSIRAQTRRVR